MSGSESLNVSDRETQENFAPAQTGRLFQTGLGEVFGRIRHLSAAAAIREATAPAAAASPLPCSRPIGQRPARRHVPPRALRGASGAQVSPSFPPSDARPAPRLASRCQTDGPAPAQPGGSRRVLAGSGSAARGRRGALGRPPRRAGAPKSRLQIPGTFFSFFGSAWFLQLLLSSERSVPRVLKGAPARGRRCGAGPQGRSPAEGSGGSCARPSAGRPRSPPRRLRRVSACAAAERAPGPRQAALLLRRSGRNGGLRPDPAADPRAERARPAGEGRPVETLPAPSAAPPGRGHGPGGPSQGCRLEQRCERTSTFPPGPAAPSRFLPGPPPSGETSLVCPPQGPGIFQLK